MQMNCLSIFLMAAAVPHLRCLRFLEPVPGPGLVTVPRTGAERTLPLSGVLSGDIRDNEDTQERCGETAKILNILTSLCY